MSGKKVYGIDLGTTYSCIAHVDEHGKPVVLPNAEGEMTTPSVVFFESPDIVVVGQAAKEVVSIHPDLCVSTIKLAMGDPNWERWLHGCAYKPQDISSFILRKVVSDAEKLMGEKVEDVVITCPAYFGISEKEATRQAGILAGLNVLYVIPEPTAAALAYGIEQDQDQVILIYDLGGATFDITLLEIKYGQITVLSTGGYRQLGGKDWDEVIIDYFIQKFEESTGTPADALLDDQETYQELLNAAERRKKALSSRQSVTEAVRFGGKRVKVDLTRETFDQITAYLLVRTLTLTKQEIVHAREKGYPKIDKLLLVGGSTYMPQVFESVTTWFPLEIRQYEPDLAVAKGAALFGYKSSLDEQIKVGVAEQPGATGRRTLGLEVGQVSRASRRPLRVAEAPKVSESQRPPRQRDQVFISYSHKDKLWLERLQVMLKPLVRKGSISLWDDTKIAPGKPWKQEIESALASARVAILLVSRDFIASDFVAENELPPLLKAAEQEGLVILWLCLGHCLYQETEIHRFQAVHDPSRPLSSRGRAQWEKVLVDLGQRVKAAIEPAPSTS